MDISNMTFTAEEKRKLVEHRDMIVRFIYDNYVGRLKEKLKYDFGGQYMGRRSYEATTNYHFGVYNEAEPFWDGNRYTDKKSAILFGEKYGGLWTNFETTTNPYVIYPVVYYWEEIKRELNRMKSDSDRMHDKIGNFEL